MAQATRCYTRQAWLSCQPWGRRTPLPVPSAVACALGLSSVWGTLWRRVPAPWKEPQNKRPRCMWQMQVSRDTHRAPAGCPSGACVRAKPRGKSWVTWPRRATTTNDHERQPPARPTDKTGRTDRRNCEEWGRAGARRAAGPAFLQADATSGHVGCSETATQVAPGQGQERVWEEAPAGPRTMGQDSRLHSCCRCLEAEQAFLGEPGADGGVAAIWKRPREQWPGWSGGACWG